MFTFGDWAYWLICLGVVAVNAGLVYLAWWALFADRANGRRRCPRCWYDVAYSPGMTCAECGYTARSEHHFHRTRRRYKLAAAAIFSCVAIALAVTERATQRGATSMLPTRVLMWGLPFADAQRSSIMSELMVRLNSATMSPDQLHDLVRRFARGDVWARPTSDAWIEKYGNLLASLRTGFIGAPALEQLLEDIPPRIDVTSRKIWPRDTPIVVSVLVRDWWPVGYECRVRVTPKIGGVEPIVFTRPADVRFSRTPFVMHLPPLDEGVRELSLQVQVERRRLPLDSQGRPQTREERAEAGEPELPWELVGGFDTSIAIRAQGNVDQVLTASNGSPLDQAVAQAFEAGVVKWSSGVSPVRFNVAPQSTFGFEFNDTAVGVHAELLRHGTLARRLNVWWLAGSMPTTGMRLSERFYGFEIDFEDEELLQSLDPHDLDGWELRLRSDATLALRGGDAPKYWEGEVKVPLRVQTRQDSAPPRPWRIP